MKIEEAKDYNEEIEKEVLELLEYHAMTINNARNSGRYVEKTKQVTKEMMKIVFKYHDYLRS